MKNASLTKGTGLYPQDPNWTDSRSRSVTTMPLGGHGDQRLSHNFLLSASYPYSVYASVLPRYVSSITATLIRNISSQYYVRELLVNRTAAAERSSAHPQIQAELQSRFGAKHASPEIAFNMQSGTPTLLSSRQPAVRRPRDFTSVRVGREPAPDLYSCRIARS